MPETTDPTFYRTLARRSPRRRSSWPTWRRARPRRPDQGRHHDDRHRPVLARLRPGRRLERAAHRFYNELHHFGWNACSSALCHQGHNGHGQPLERRYLIVPGLRSSRNLHVLDTKPDPRNPTVVRAIEAELAAKAGYSRPHTVHCGPGGIFMFSLGGANGNDGPGGVALLDHDTFDVIGPWEQDRGDQYFGYDGWWHLNHDTVITSEWATPSMIENGLNPEDLLGRKFGHHLNFWSMSERTLTQRIDLGDAHQMVLEVRPAHDPNKTWGFVGVVISVEDLSGSVFLWHRDGDRWLPARSSPSRPSRPTLTCCPRPLAVRGGALPISDIDLSVDDRWLYVSCWGTGELKQYDVSDIFHPRETGSVKLGGIVRRQPHLGRTPGAARRRAADGGGQPRRQASLCDQLAVRGLGRHLLPRGCRRLGRQAGRRPRPWRIAPDPRFFPNGGDFRGLRVHQTCCRSATTPPATPTATPADMRPLAHHPGEDSLVNLLLVGGAGLSLMVVEGRAWLAAARARLTRRARARAAAARRQAVAVVAALGGRAAPGGAVLRATRLRQRRPCLRRHRRATQRRYGADPAPSAWSAGRYECGWATAAPYPDGDELVVVARPKPRSGSPCLGRPRRPRRGRRLDATRCFRAIPSSTCFTCGPDRAPGDGLRIFPWPLPGSDLWARRGRPDLGRRPGRAGRAARVRSSHGRSARDLGELRRFLLLAADTASTMSQSVTTSAFRAAGWRDQPGSGRAANALLVGVVAVGGAGWGMGRGRGFGDAPRA